MKLKLLSIFLSAAIPAAFSATSGSAPIFLIDEGVDFTLDNTGASDYLFNWTDPGGGFSFTNEVDPTLVLTVGETYTFERVSGAHPFVIMDDSAASFITGTDGSFSRTTTDGAFIDAATLTPIADFTADPAPSGDLITWTPTETGGFYYTCRVTSHTEMTGMIQIVPEPSTYAMIAGTIALGIVFVHRRNR